MGRKDPERQEPTSPNSTSSGWTSYSTRDSHLDSIDSNWRARGCCLANTTGGPSHKNMKTLSILASCRHYHMHHHCVYDTLDDTSFITSGTKSPAEGSPKVVTSFYLGLIPSRLTTCHSSPLQTQPAPLPYIYFGGGT